MSSRDELPKGDIRGFIRRAGRLARDEESLSDAFARMEADDHSDASESVVDSLAASAGASSAWFDSHAGDSNGSSSAVAEDVRRTLDAPNDFDSETPPRDPPRDKKDARPFRPTRRAPMAVLKVYDDGLADAQEVRVRQTPFVIGRQDGDLVIGHERQMSRRHARIDRVKEGDQWRWRLGDLRSTNGTFIQTDVAELEDGVEILLAGELVRFIEAAKSGPPVLVKIAPDSEEDRIELTADPGWIGTDTSRCLPFLSSSPFLDPHHFRVERSRGVWRVVDLGSTNHLWVSITRRVELHDGAMFQIGEQRFSFHLP